MKDPFYLSHLNLIHHRKLFQQAKVGDYFQYSFSYSLAEIVKMAEDYGVKVRYQEPDSMAYKRFGCNTVKVIEKEVPIEIPKSVLFNPQMLMIHMKGN